MKGSEYSKSQFITIKLRDEHKVQAKGGMFIADQLLLIGSNKDNLGGIKMKRIFLILFVVGVMLSLVSVTAFAHTEADPFITDLVAGGGNPKSAVDIGDVLVWNDGENLYVKYVVTDGAWCLTETHLEVALFLEDIPQTKKGSPIPGHFTYGGSHNCAASVEYSIPLDGWTPGTEIFIAAHGVAHTGGMDGFGATLPAQVMMATSHPGLGFGAPSYFDVTLSGGTTLDGMYDGYCLATNLGVLESGLVNVYSSYELLPPEVPIDKPENLDLVNWIINQDFVDQPSACGGNFTFGDMQWAIWNLLDSDPPTAGGIASLFEWDLCRAQEIVDAAMMNGEGFVPGCGDKLGIILDPVEWRQPVLIWIDAPCEGEDETAWGGDYFGTPLEFPGSDWSIYFSYIVQ